MVTFRSSSRASTTLRSEGQLGKKKQVGEATRNAPESLLTLHNVGENSSSEEDHVLAPWRVLNANLELLLVGKRREGEAGGGGEMISICFLRRDIVETKSGEATGPGTHVQSLGVVVQHLVQVELLHLLLQSTRQTGVHARSTRENDVLVQLGTDVDGSRLDGVEQELCEHATGLR